MASTTGPTRATAIASLDRHERRRGAGLPTVTTLVGPIGLAVQSARRWAEARGRPVVQVESPDSRDVMTDWVGRLLQGRDLDRDAVAWLARRLGRPADQIGPSLGRKTPYEMAAFLESALPANSASQVESACRWILARSDVGEAIGPTRLVTRLGEALSGGDEPWLRVLVALRGLVSPGRDPLLLMARREGSPAPAAWIESAARLLAELAMAEPKLALILVLSPSEFDGYDRQAPESRVKALIRESVIPIPSLGGDAVGGLLAGTIPGAGSQLAGTIRRLADDGASDELVELYREAARAASVPGPIEAAGEDRARSAAERFLFERLESLPETAGLFRLNASLGFRFGPGEVEVDLAAPALGLVVEVDGYHHFRDDDGYRRDRRKDLELQVRGFLVVRVLADDVVRRLEDVLDMILAAVASRRGHGLLA